MPLQSNFHAFLHHDCESTSNHEKRRIVHTCIDTAPLLICNCLVHNTLLLLSTIQLETLVFLHGGFL